MSTMKHNAVFLTMFLVLAAIGTGDASALQGTTTLDVAFVMDGSGSIDAADFALQKQGLIAAVQNPQLVPTNGTVGITLVQFANGVTQVEVPFAVIGSAADVSTVVAQINAIPQISGCTNPADGISVAASILTSSGGATSQKSICLSTDGEPNCGSSLTSAVQAAQSAGIDTFGVIGIECPGLFNESDLQNVYGTQVFGGGTATMVFSSVEFANSVGASCFGAQLKLVGLEVNQSVQDWSNSVPLVTGKRTYVRAHIEPSDPTVVQTVAQARLRAFNTSGSELSGSPLQPVNVGGQVIAKQNAVARRGDWNASLNFRLPSSWTTGTVTLRLEGVGSAIDCSSATATDDNCELTATFTPVDRPELKFIGIKYMDRNGTTINPPAITDLGSRLVALYPVASADVELGTTDMTSASMPPTPDEILAKMQQERFWDLCWTVLGLGCQRIYYGVLDSSGSANATSGGSAYCPGKVGWGFLPPNNAQVYGYNRHAHEICHSLGFNHAPFCLAASSPSCPITLSYDSSGSNATLGPMSSGDDEFVYGLDTKGATPAVLDPNLTYALMSYCGGAGATQHRWVAKPAYERLQTELNNVFLPPPTLNGGVGQFLVVAGKIDVAADAVEFLPFFDLASKSVPPTQPPGPYLLRMSNASGRVIYETNFSPHLPLADESVPAATMGWAPGDSLGGGSSAEAGTIGSFIIPVPADPSIVAAEVLLDGTSLAGMSASRNAPEVTITFPNGGRVITGSAEIQWVGSDRDGEELRYIVQYSSDMGTTWQTLVVDWPNTSLLTDFSLLPGSANALIRVLVSDGFNASEDVSDEFFVTDQAPTVTIVSPAEGEEFTGIQTIFFSALATDVEDGDLDGAQVSWTSDIDGTLGTGANLELVASSLMEAQHTVVVTVEDSVGNQTFAEVEIAVETVFVEECTIVTFEEDDNGFLTNGQIPQFSELFALSTTGAHFGAAVFDSTPNGPNETSTDPDLLVNQGMVLILQEEPAMSSEDTFQVPDDAAFGGTFHFEFVESRRVESVDLIDVCPGPGNQDVLVEVFDSLDRKRSFDVPAGWTTDVSVGGAGVGTLDLTGVGVQAGVSAFAEGVEDPAFDENDVVRLVVTFSGSGAIDNLRVCSPEKR